MELYKKHRPVRLRDMVGNRSTIKTLAGMLTNNKLPQVLLLHGPSGCGKTTIARILQTILKCNPLDCHELNSSSYRGIDSIREMAELCTLYPNGECRVWILDEVHKWTSDAQHAALKLLEDTPSRNYFFLCTTNPEKLIKPLRNRCCELAVVSLSRKELLDLLNRVSKDEGIDLEDSSKDILIDGAEGSARQMLVLLDRLQHIDPSNWDETIAAGQTTEPEVLDLCRALIGGKSWVEVSKILRGLTLEPESVRWAVLGYANAILQKKQDARAYAIIISFSDPFYETKKAGLTASCYEVVAQQ